MVHVKRRKGTAMPMDARGWYAALISLVLLAGWVGTARAQGELAVIVHADNPVPSLSREQVRRIYLGKRDRFPGGGGEAVPVDLTDSRQGLRARFYEEVVGKSLSQIKAYWATKVFSGAALPPEQQGDSAAVARWVAAHPRAIGFGDAEAVAGQEGVHVVLRVAQ